MFSEPDVVDRCVVAARHSAQLLLVVMFESDMRVQRGVVESGVVTPTATHRLLYVFDVQVDVHPRKSWAFEPTLTASDHFLATVTRRILVMRGHF